MMRPHFALLVVIASVPYVALAQTNSAVSAADSIAVLVTGNMLACGSGCVSGLLNGLFTASLSVGAMLAVLRIGYAGWLYMGSADMWSSKSQAIEVFQNAIIGLVLLLGVWLILYQINPEILNLDITRDIK